MNSQESIGAAELMLTRHKHAYYSGTISQFLSSSANQILGDLAANSGFSIELTQREAWLTQIDILKKACNGLCGSIFFEYVVPRIGSRIDTVLVVDATVFVIEFKVGESTFLRDAIDQVWDYSLDLKNFHEASHNVSILPVLVATSASSIYTCLPSPHGDGVFSPICASPDDLRSVIHNALRIIGGTSIDPHAWASSPYCPTPNIIQAAQALYSQHSVEAISRSDAGARNLRITSKRVEALADQAKSLKQKIIIFVTGVPGAGKTLVGLNIATRKQDKSKPTHAVFLSGNGPLVRVLTEALSRDEVSRLKRLGEKPRKGNIVQKVKAFIQNVHHFRDAGIRADLPPADHVVIFDEAQRAWDREMTSQFMQRKKGYAGFSQSEPEFLISYLDRHKDWAVIVCLVGGGQEINRGEAGISAWLDAVRTSFPWWHVHLSPELTDSEYAAGHALDTLKEYPQLFKDTSLHLSVSMRSFRAEKVSHFVKSILDQDTSEATSLLKSFASRYPVVLTRDLNVAKRWIRDSARGTERYGLVASSGAQRLKPHAIDVRVEIDPVHWFLNESMDTRSSYFMEDAATEFQVQGLELDWTCVTWDADLRYVDNFWGFHSFVGSRWTKIASKTRQQYLLNAYRVLLTRARQGMVIFVPPGDEKDPTRLPDFYDGTHQYLASLGIASID